MDNVNEQARSISFTDNQLPWEYGYPMDICLPSCGTQPQNILAHPHFSPLPSPATAEGFAVSTGHLPNGRHGSLHTPAAMGTVDFTVTPNPGLSQSQCQWIGMNSNLVNVTQASVSSLHQTPQRRLCGWPRDYEPGPVLPGIPSIPQSLSTTLAHSYPNMGQYDAWALDGSIDTCAASPDGDTSLSTSGFLGLLGALADYDYVPDARADPQPSIALTRHNAMPSIQSASFPYNEPSYGPHWFFECQWSTNGVLCETRVTADRRSVVGHLQHVHGIKPKEEKARETCLWEQCGTILNKESLARHILTVHLKGRVHCAKCGVFFAREDSLKRHLKGGQHKVPSDNSARQPSRNHAGFR